MDQGVHEIVGFDHMQRMDVTCSHITFVGKGKDQTTIRGGFWVAFQQHVTFEELTIMNPSGRGHGLHVQGDGTSNVQAHVDVLKCTFQKCGNYGMFVNGGATATATQCAFMENGGHGVCCCGANTKAKFNDCKIHHNDRDGLNVQDHAVVNLHGTKTDIHSNKQVDVGIAHSGGICASLHGKVNIHLPLQHNTSHDNIEEDRVQTSGGSIANINVDGTFTHVE